MLDTEIMTENQLNIIKSRFENRLTNQYVNYINQMIDLARECGLAPQETVVSPFNVAGIEGSDRTVSATPAHDVRAMANQPQASNQALSGANRCNNDDSNSVNQRSGQGALMKVNPQWNVESIWSLNLVAQYCNKTDIEIDAEIDKADRETTLRIIDFQPMTHDQLNRILHDARVKLGRRKMNEISTRLEYCPPGKREINTPYWRRLYMNESPKVFEDTISSNVIHVGRQIEYQRMLVPMTVIVTGAKYRDFISCNPSGANEETAQYIIDISETIIMRSVTDRQTVSVEDTDRQTVSVEDTARQTVSVEDTARQTDSVDDTARQTDSVDDTARQTDSVDDIARQTDSGNVEWTRTGYVLIHLLVNLTVENYNELRFLSREGILN
ncbi:MAG: hypothetical protein KAG53_02050 [Endozoicomonadaceae bacterium]|nr:hypothetical protein [Endozoicomonadaceae bacterium]